LNFNQQEARNVSATALIPDSIYFFPMQWSGKSVKQTVTEYKNLSSPLILVIDGVDNLGITYLFKNK
jgi:hypothetical protein